MLDGGIRLSTEPAAVVPVEDDGLSRITWIGAPPGRAAGGLQRRPGVVDALVAPVVPIPHNRSLPTEQQLWK